MQSINLNLVPGSFQQVFNCSQGDIGRQLTAKLFDGSTAYEIPVGSTVKIKATKPSGFGFDESATFLGSTVTITTVETMTNEWGRFPAELVITKDGNVIGTANFLFNIEKNPHPDSTVDGDAEEVIPELTLLVERVEAAASSVLDMEVVATTLPAGSQASYSYDEDLNKATFGIPQGEAGAGAAGVVASAYSSSKTYKVGDYVLHNSNLYRCITAITTAEAFTAAHWTQIVLADDVSDLKTDLNGIEKTIAVTWQDGYVNLDGDLVSSTAYKHTTPIWIRTGEKITISTRQYLFSAIALTDENETFYTPLVKAPTGSFDLKDYSYIAPQNCYVVLSAYTTDNSQTVKVKMSEYATLADVQKEGIDTENKLIDKLSLKNVTFEILRNTIIKGSPLGQLAPHPSYDCLAVYFSNIDNLIINNIDNTSGVGRMFYNGEPNENTSISGYGALPNLYPKSFIFDSLPKDAKCIVLCCFRVDTSTPVDFSSLEVFARGKGVGKSYCALNIFPFRTITGRTEYLYKESCVAGLRPMNNFVLDTTNRNPNINNYSEKAFAFSKDTAGVYDVTLKATDEEMNITEKTIPVTVKVAPAKKLLNKSELNVCYIGDSLIYNNGNLIGSEWNRMLNTDDSETHTIGDAILLPTLYATDGKINLCGEVVGRDGARYTPVAHTNRIMQGKRTTAIGELKADISENPFYNPNSSEPDEVGADGFNKRVDFGWWFDNVIGLGKNPDIIYLATGPNDYANLYDWNENSVKFVVSNIIAICKKIKAVCDSRANGNSDTVIKLIQHQPYDYASRTYNFPQFMQRVLWQKTAEGFVSMAQSESIGSYAELIPVASRFDIEVGYTYTEERNNPRYTGYSDRVASSDIHMNDIGSYNYADVLVADFMADERFD